MTGTDTGVGKTVITCGMARMLSNRGTDVGVMKPFASGIPDGTPYNTADVRMLMDSARVVDPVDLVNPQFYPLPASPYTAYREGHGVNFDLVVESFLRLADMHDIMLVEGIGGVMTPLSPGYFLYDIIKRLKLDTILVTSNRLGAINHVLMSASICRHYGVAIRGIIINCIDDGYEPAALRGDLEALTGLGVLATIPKIDPFEPGRMHDVVESVINLDSF